MTTLDYTVEIHPQASRYTLKYEENVLFAFDATDNDIRKAISKHVSRLLKVHGYETDFKVSNIRVRNTEDC